MGSTPNGSALNANGTRLVLCADPTSKDATPRHGTCPKAQVRLAAAGCLHTAVALELSAGQARAAGPTRKHGRLTTPPPRRPTRNTLTGPGLRRKAGQRVLPEARAMARSPHLRVSRPPARPAGRTGTSNRASNLKSPPVAFGISRPTRTPTEESTPRLRSGEAADRGLDCITQSPGNGRRQPTIQDPTYARRHSSGPEARHPADSGGGAAAGPPGRPEARAMARTPPPGIAASSPPSGGGKRYWIVRLDARLSRPPPAAVGDPSRGATAPYHGTLLSPRRRLTRTEPAKLRAGAPHVVTAPRQ